MPAYEWLKDLPVQAEEIGFRPEEMVFCQTCRRKNPPTRLKCIYCAAQLDFGEEQLRQIKPVLRKMEIWEKGFNLIYLPGKDGLSGEQINEIAKMTRLQKETLQILSKTGKALPLARAESEKEAEIVKAILSEYGIETLVLSDEKLNTEKSPKRLRGVEFLDDKLQLRLFNTNQTAEIPKQDLILVVTGAVFERRMETTERRGRKGSKLLNTTETASDELLADLYSRDSADGFRIEQDGFDFSCLGEDKKMLAVENMQILIEKLRLFAAEAKIVDDYVKIRSVLSSVWEVEEKKDSKGLVRERFGKFNLGNVTIVSNLRQFTKYSRLQRHLL